VQQGSSVAPCPVEEPQVTATRPSPAPPCQQHLTLGESIEGRPIELFVFGEGGETTLIIGGIHGNEATGSYVAIALIEYLKEHPDIYAGRCIMIAPAVNPDGLAAGTRGNANGIDINRNFPATNFPRRPDRKFGGGRKPLSEPETQAIRDAIEHARPAKIISLHSIRRGRHGNNFDGPARDLAEEMSRYNGYPVLSTMGYPTPGSLGSWAGVDQGIPTITLELPRDADGPTCWAENRAALLAAIRLSMGAPADVDPPLLGK
jgi:protein MpaA